MPYVTIVEACGDKTTAILLLAVRWLFPQYFQLPSLGLALD